MNNPDIVVTDDELIAVAVLERGALDAPTETVDLSSATARAEATGRGLRSLGLRGILTDQGGLTDEALPAVRGVTASATAVLAFVDEDHVAVPHEDSFWFRRHADGGWVAQTVAPGGVHRFALCSGEEAFGLIADLLSSRAAVTQDVSLCAVVRSESGGARGGLVARDGRVNVMVRSADGDLTEGEGTSSDPVDLRRELERLVGRDVNAGAEGAQ